MIVQMNETKMIIYHLRMIGATDKVDIINNTRYPLRRKVVPNSQVVVKRTTQKTTYHMPAGAPPILLFIQLHTACTKDRHHHDYVDKSPSNDFRINTKEWDRLNNNPP